MAARNLPGNRSRKKAAVWLVTVCRCCAVLVLLIPAGSSEAQVYHQVAPPALTLPPTPEVAPTNMGDFDAFGPSPKGSLLVRPARSLGMSVIEPGHEPVWQEDLTQATTIQRFRQAMVQKVEFAGGYIYRDGLDQFGYSFASAGVVMVVPLGSTDNIVLVTPRYRTDWLSGPDTIDVPERVHSAVLDLGWRLKFAPRWMTIVGFRPGFMTDYDSSSNGFRVSGVALVSYDVVPEMLTMLAGVVYVDRNDFNWIPAFGLTWIPSSDLRFELTFPKPKIARRIKHVPFRLEDWVYVSGIFGGGTWSVLRTSGLDDELTLRDFRVSAGFERVVDGGTGFNVELGYVFGRKLEYEVTGDELSFRNSFVLETGLSF